MATSLNTSTTFFFSTTTKPNNHNSLSFKPNTFTPPNPTTPRHFSSCLNVARPKRSSVNHVYNSGKFIVHSSSQSELEPESTSGAQSDAPFEDTIDIQLPRRSLLVQFTCNSCAERTERYINRLAYERGLVYVQCAGCLKYHKLVDNLGLVIEHNLLENTDTTPS